MKHKGKILLTLFLISWVVLSAALFIHYSTKFIGNSYFNSESFLKNVENFQQQLERYVLNPFDAEKAKKNVYVTESEVEYYRSYYGTLTEQIENIRAQYETRISEAEADASLKELLIKERDEKIEDVKKNFTDDAYVEEKIKNIKYYLIDQFAKQEEQKRKEFLSAYSYFSYNVKNTETGEQIEQGDQTSPVFKTEYKNSNNYEETRNIYVDPQNYDATVQSEGFLFNGFDVNMGRSQFVGTICIPKSAMNQTSFNNSYKSFVIVKSILYSIWATGILALIALLTFAKPSLKLFTQTNPVKELFLKWPLDIKVGVLFVVIVYCHYILNQSNYIFSDYMIYPSFTFDLFFTFALLFLLISAIIFGVLWIFESINSEEKLTKAIKSSITYRLSDGIKDLFLNRSIAIQTIAILMIAFFSGVGFAGIFTGMTYDSAFLVFFVILFIIGVPVSVIFLSRMGYLNRIIKQTEEMAEGRYISSIKVRGKSPLAKHASNLNKMREGIQKSMSEQAKSERLKTELITNVSHDLRTPLTSIITYTDLLKNPNITEEERKHYIEVLDKKSARLKTLIEDLFEVSKMASGDIELHKQRVDLTQMLQQTIGEHQEDFKNANLQLRVTIPKESIFAYVDSQKWWRVFDNLIVNALKYAMSGTRVYVSLNEHRNEAMFTIKNVSNYELSENIEELKERFKRADASRHTDGSGLGLAIVQSIVDLHNGRMNVDMDGDLFKVTVIVKTDM